MKAAARFLAILACVGLITGCSAGQRHEVGYFVDSIFKNHGCKRDAYVAARRKLTANAPSMTILRQSTALKYADVLFIDDNFRSEAEVLACEKGRDKAVQWCDQLASPPYGDHRAPPVAPGAVQFGAAGVCSYGFSTDTTNDAVLTVEYARGLYARYLQFPQDVEAVQKGCLAPATDQTCPLTHLYSVLDMAGATGHPEGKVVYCGGMTFLSWNFAFDTTTYGLLLSRCQEAWNETKDPTTAYSLALIYDYGRGVLRDVNSALYWYGQAKDGGIDTSARMAELQQEQANALYSAPPPANSDGANALAGLAALGCALWDRCRHAAEDAILRDVFK